MWIVYTHDIVTNPHTFNTVDQVYAWIADRGTYDYTIAQVR